MKIEVRLDHDGDVWGAFAEGAELHGCVVGAGNTRESVLADFQEALKCHLAGLRADGIDVPYVTQIAIREIVETRELAAA